MLSDDVPPGPLLLDTDVLSYLIANRGDAATFAALISDHPIALAFAVVGELRAWAIARNWGAESKARLEATIRQYVVYVPDDATTERYAELHAHPQIGGQLRGAPTRNQNDMCIAACSLARPERPPVVTNNLADYQLIARYFPLKLVNPRLQVGEPGWP